MAKQGTLTVRIVSDTKQAEAGLKRFDKGVQSTGDKLDSAGRKMTLFASVPVAAAMGIATKAASDLNETVSKSDAVFGDAAAEVEKWGDQAAESIGQSKREALDAASTFGNLFVQLGVGADEAADMSIAMTELSSDFASFHNADISDVIDAQAAAFRGEYDALQRFVPTINAATVEQKALEQTGKAATKELTAQEKALAVQTLMLEGAGDALGDFARTQDSAANQTRIAQAAMEDASAEIGQALLPLVAELAGGVADLAGMFADLPDAVQTGILAIAGVVVAAGPVLTVAGNVMKLNSALRDTDGNLTRTGRGVSKFGKALGALAIAGVAVEMYQMAQAAAKLEVNVDKAARATDDELVAAFERLDDFDGQGLEFFGELAEGNIGTARRLRDALADTGRETEDLDGVLRDAAEAERQAATDAESAADEIDGLGDTSDDASGNVDDYGSAVENAADASRDLLEATEELNDELNAQFDPLFAAQDALIDNSEAQRDVAESTQAVRDAQAEYNAVVAEFGRKSPEARRALSDIEDAERNLDDANRDAARSAIDVTTATRELAAQMDAGNVDIEAATRQIDAWADQGLITTEQAGLMKDELNLVALAAESLDGQQAIVTADLDLTRFWRNLAAARAALGDRQLQDQLDNPHLRTSGPQLYAGGIADPAAARSSSTPPATSSPQVFQVVLDSRVLAEAVHNHDDRTARNRGDN